MNYKGDQVRVILRSSIGNRIFAEVKIWQGCFWDVFKMSVNIEQKGVSSKVGGICRAKIFLSNEFDIEYIIDNLDRIVVGLVDGFIKEGGEKYKETINTLNHAIATGSSVIYSGGQEFWELDPDKIAKESGCPPE
jgi:hypothetical protein